MLSCNRVELIALKLWLHMWTSFITRAINVSHVTELLLLSTNWPMLLHTSVKKEQIATFIYHTIAHKCQQQICPSNVTFMSYIQIIWHSSLGKICQYICHIWTYWDQLCDQEHCTQMTKWHKGQVNAKPKGSIA